MDKTFNPLSDQKRNTNSKRKARLDQAEGSGAPVSPLPKVKSAPRPLPHRHVARSEPDSLAFCVEDAARLIGVSRATLYVLISAGDLRTVKIRKRRLVPRDALLELLATAAEED